MDKPIFEPGKEYRTRDGRRARVYATDADCDEAIHGAVLVDMPYPQWEQVGWETIDGSFQAGVEDDLDLMPPEPAKERFLLWGSKAEGPDNGYVLEVEIQPDDTLKAVR